VARTTAPSSLGKKLVVMFVDIPTEMIKEKGA
jgi:hypothetical protein